VSVGRTRDDRDDDDVFKDGIDDDEDDDENDDGTDFLSSPSNIEAGSCEGLGVISTAGFIMGLTHIFDVQFQDGVISEYCVLSSGKLLACLFACLFACLLGYAR